MGLTNDVIAAWALALVGPAILFVAALVIRQVPPPESQPARTADRIVKWYAAHPQFALWVLLLLLPLSAFLLGSVALLRTWGDNPRLQYYTWRALTEIPEHWPALSIGGATLLAAGVLAMITTHLFAGQARSGA
jgi:cytochrome b561